VTTINGGTLALDFSTINQEKLSNNGLVLAGGRIDLIGGSKNENVGSTTINSGASSITQQSGTSKVRFQTITRNAGGTLNLGAASIADTDTINTGSTGILGAWATVAGTDWASNADNKDGPILAYTAYTDVTRLSSGTKAIADGTNTNVRVIEGTGTAANITLGETTTTINTLNQSASGGTSAATIDSASRTLRVDGIMVAAGAGGLTIGTAANSGTLMAKTSGGELILHNHSGNGLTINSVIADNTSASALTKAGIGTATLTGDNTYTGQTYITAGTLAINGNQTTASGNITVSSGARLQGLNTAVAGADLTTIQSGGTLASGLDFNNSGATVSDLAFEGGSIFEWDITNTGTFSLTDVEGALTGSGAIFKILLSDFTDSFWNTGDVAWTSTQIFGKEITAVP
jgi:autotransporter-associated beta strand protein